MKIDVNYKFLTDDLCFKKVFSKDKILEDFINSLMIYLHIPLKYYFSDICFQYVMMPDNKRLKLMYGDIVATLSDGVIINLEMYKHIFNKNDYNKSFNYMNRLFDEQMKSCGNNYGKAKKVISVNLIKGNFRRVNDKLVNKYSFRNECSNITIDEGNTDLYLIRFDLVNKMEYNKREKRFIKWLRLINLESLEEIEKISRGDEIMEEAVRIVKEWNKKNIHTLEDYVEEKSIEVAQKAEEKARKKSALEVAKKMLNDKLDIKTIIKYTGLTKKQIEALKN